MNNSNKKERLMTCFTLYPSPVGDLLLTSDGSALTGLALKAPCREYQAADLAIFNSAKAWLADYFAGKPREIDFPLSPAGTDFQRRVWEILLTIPYGQTTTYGAIAGQLGEKMSAQAVGQAVGKNPIAIIIPCHRVVGSKGQLTGYAWGVETKKWLLRHEEETK